MKLPAPFLPVKVRTEGLNHHVSVVDRDIVFGANGLPASIISQGVELLAAPVRLVGVEDGEPIVWDDNYPDNESESFIQSRSDEDVVICGAQASPRFIVNTCITTEYDGNIDIDLKLMPRGKTVAEEFGLAAIKPYRYQMDRLWLEIPLNKENATLFNQFPNTEIQLSDGAVLPEHRTSSSGAVTAQDMAMPFKALLWLGNEDRGLGFFAESARNWQPADEKRTIEILHQENCLLVRVHLLDSHPASWSEDPAEGRHAYFPISFGFGLQPTPVKPFPQNPYPIRGLHLDCFIKTKGNYIDFLADENRYDRLKEKGVDTLILHEKWNKSQNWFELSEFTAMQIKTIVEECHKRGIKVLTYFGYEIASMAPIFTETAMLVRNEENGKQRGGWYRVPYQRDYVVCYNNEWSDLFAQGVAHIMDTYHTDGIYLDSTSRPIYCTNLEHGCGWYDHNGKLQGTYTIKGVRDLFKKLKKEVGSRGGIINVHSFGYANFTALPFIDLNWYGENLQFDYVAGRYADVPLDYFRAEYTGRNMGVPVEFIAYENRPVWTFENAISLSIIHGILPRPNDINIPLDVTSEVWKIFDRFPIEQSEWKPYWNNGASASDPRIKISYYRYTNPAGEASLLAFFANTSKEAVESFTLNIPEAASLTRWTDLSVGEEYPGTASLKPYDYRILFIR